MAPRKRPPAPTDLSPAELAGEAPLLRTLPQDLDAERGLLGSLLLDPQRVMDICTAKGLLPESFVDTAHRALYAAVEHLSARGIPVDAVSLNNYLTGIGQGELVGGFATLTDLVERTPTSAHAEYYADLVMERYLRRCILGTVRKIETEVYDMTLAADHVLSTAEQSILDIGKGRNRLGSTLDWKTSVGETLATLQRQLETPGELSGLPTGFKKLDEILRGMHNGEMIVLAARPSMGKTSLAMNIAECVAAGQDIMGIPFKTRDPGEKRQHGVLIFSLEMPQVQLTTRMLCGLAGVSAHEIERGFLKKAPTLRALETAARELEKMPIYCDEQGGLDVLELRARARHIHKKHSIGLIVIDYLQLLSHRAYAAQGQQVMVSKISGEIKAMAKELNVPVIVLSQLSRNPEQRTGGDEKPRNSDLRDSGAIEQDADIILLLRRPCRMSSKAKEHDVRDLAIVEVSKNRNGRIGDVRLTFKDDITRFINRDETLDESQSSDMQPVS